MRTGACWFVGLLVLLLGACAPSASRAGEEPIDHLERDLGGPVGVLDLFAHSSADELEDVLAEYGIGHVTQAVITDCPRYYPGADRSTWHSLDGEFYYVDNDGRPSRAYADLPPVAADERSTSCQTSIGRWGDAENPGNDYDGGHLIGAQLGGWGGRANIVPQDANFNRGTWRALENKMAKCSALPSGRLRYYITVGYADSSAVTPISFGMEIKNNSTGASVSLSFSNTDGGGPSGPAEKSRGVNFLAAQGCN